VPAVQAQLKATGQCGNAGQDPCNSWCQCEIVQETGDALRACQNGQEGIAPGYCYVDNPESPLVKKCPPNQQQLLRFVDDGKNKTPAQGAVAFIACIGKAVPGGSDAGM